MNKQTCCIARPVKLTGLTANNQGDSGIFAEFDSCDCNSCCKRVTLFAPPPLINPALTDEWTLKVIAEITFGCKKSCFGGQVEVDFKQGVVLDLSGDYVSVGYKLEEVINTNLEGAIIPPISLGAMIACCGAGAARGCATRTYAQETIAANAGFAVWRIPPFAYAVTIVSSSGLLDDSTTRFEFYGSGATTLLYSVTGDLAPDPIMVPAGAQQFAVINDNTGSTLTVEPSFLIGV